MKRKYSHINPKVDQNPVSVKKRALLHSYITNKQKLNNTPNQNINGHVNRIPPRRITTVSHVNRTSPLKLNNALTNSSKPPNLSAQSRKITLGS
eukprot:UN32785